MKSNGFRVLMLAAACGVLAAGCMVVRERRAVPAGEVVVVDQAPPAERIEGRGRAPSPAHVWIGGHWAWRGRWVWESGHWMLRPSTRAEWTPGHWDKDPRGSVWVPGRWR
jgi:hypothetical protein